MGQMLPGGQILTSQSQTLAKKRWDNVSFRIKGLRPKGMRSNWQRPNVLQSKRSQSKARRDKACPGPKNHKPKSQSPKFQRSKWPKSKQPQPKNRQSQARWSPKKRVQKGHGTMSGRTKSHLAENLCTYLAPIKRECPLIVFNKANWAGRILDSRDKFP